MVSRVAAMNFASERSSSWMPQAPSTSRRHFSSAQSAAARRKFPLLLAAGLIFFLAAPSPAHADRGPGRIPVDEAKAAEAGIRKLPPAKRLILYTDLPSSPEVDAMPALFDQAFPQWCEYFHVDPAQQANWQMTGFVMKDKTRFQRAGLLPADLPPFPHGYCRGYNLWLYDKPTDYYRRHLLLHEGVHGFMFTVLGSCGPPWYMEGMAELLATHELRDGRLLLGYMPARREEVPDWGRVRIVKDAFAARRAMGLDRVIDFSPTAHQDVAPYAWSWAAAIFLDRHPRYRDRFRQLYQHVLESDFNDRFHQAYRVDWREMNEEWQVFVSGMEYGYDIARAAIAFVPGQPLPASGATVRVAADRGWQSSGLRLDAGVKYRVTASGRLHLAALPKDCWCEPGGVSIHYYQGRPLGLLLGAVRPDKPAEKAPSALLRPVVIGLDTLLSPAEAGTLYLKINGSAADLAGNSGEIKVRVE